jgi:hypothetical protein
MVGVGDVMFVRFDEPLSDAAFDRHLRELARAIDLRADQHRIGVVYDCVAQPPVDARRRQRSAEVLAARRDKLERTTAGFVMVSPSPVMRGVLRAVFWLAPPPYEWTVTDDVRGALHWLAPRVSGLDVDDVVRRYADAYL